MDEKLENNDWINEAPFLAGLHKVNPFSTPAGYFEGSKETMSAHAYVEGLRQEKGNTDMTVPDEYFEDLKENIFARISLEGLKEKAEVDGFAVPQGYFDHLQGKIMDQVSVNEAHTTERPVLKLWYAGMLKYAVAACIVIISAVGLYRSQTAVQGTPAAIMQVAEVSAEDQALFDMDEQEIIDQIPAQGTQRVTNTTATESEMESYILTNYTQNEIAANY